MNLQLEHVTNKIRHIHALSELYNVSPVRAWPQIKSDIFMLLVSLTMCLQLEHGLSQIKTDIFLFLVSLKKVSPVRAWPVKNQV